MVILTSPIDELDARLIAELREHPRLGLLEISRRLGVARGTVQARLAKLEGRGVVTGFGPEIDLAPLTTLWLAPRKTVSRKGAKSTQRRKEKRQE